MACLTSMIEPLRVANEIAGREVFAWTLISETGDRVTASAGVVFDPDLALLSADRLDHLFVLGAPTSGFADPGRSNGHLRRMARFGVTMGAISGGVFALARAGLLTGTTVSVHWCYAAAFAAEFPDIAATDSVIALATHRITAAGAAAAFDLALHLIASAVGSSVATETACWFQHPVMRGQGVLQRKPTQNTATTDDLLPDLLRRATDLFAAHIDDPLRVSDVADSIGISTRQLERLFKDHTGMSPLHYYRMIRMKTARQLLLYTDDRLFDIALAVGYSSSSVLIQNYRDVFGTHPGDDRRKSKTFRIDADPLPQHA